MRIRDTAYVEASKPYRFLSLDNNTDRCNLYSAFEEYYEELKYVLILPRYLRPRTSGFNTLHIPSTKDRFLKLYVGFAANIHEHIKKKTIIIPLLKIFHLIPKEEHEVFFDFLMSNWEDFLGLLTEKLIHFYETRDDITTNKVSGCFMAVFGHMYRSFKPSKEDTILSLSSLSLRSSNLLSPEMLYDQFNVDKEFERIAELELRPAPSLWTLPK